MHCTLKIKKFKQNLLELKFLIEKVYVLSTKYWRELNT